jgi:S1-C subfamily serine protease
MNLTDLVILLLILLTIVRGAEIGLVRQVSSLVGLTIGIVAGSLISSWVKLLLHERKINTLDRAFGSVIGVFICLMLVWFGSAVISAIPSPWLQQNVRDSRSIVWLDRKLPPATDIMKWFEGSLASTNIPQIVKELEPSLPTTNAKLPDVGSFNNVVTNAQPSVVEIEGRSCYGITVGSGFVADDGIVVTNAHVVAGMIYPYVQDDSGRHLASIIGFDPDLDIAVLRTNNLAGKPLPMLDDRVDNGTQGVVLGYPGGGPFTVKPAAVIEHFTALGKNIYEEGVDRRDVYALKADIREGNSGGPLLDSKGRVIGVAFARSTAYNEVGYALSTPAVIDTLAAAEQNPDAGESARCSAE